MTTITPDPQIARILDQAADHLKAYGLLSGSYWSTSKPDEATIKRGPAYDGSSSCCTVGAIAVALGYTASHEDVADNVVCNGLDIVDDTDELFGVTPAAPAVVALMHHLGAETIEELWAWSDCRAKQGREAEVIHTLRQCAAAYRGEVA